ncbi:MAG: ribonuclease E activity regulator RraA [Verrucomicrobia bacterium]|nr:ribonuclease E activity regulator RraA [Verrucomicrobiota bacterium]
MHLSTADLMDRGDPSLQSCTLQFRQFGRKRAFFGAARTLRTIEDNAQVRELLSGPGAGAVLVVDGGGSLRAALLGDQLASLGARNGWSGVILHGAVRDAAALAAIDLGIKALGTNPRKSAKLGTGTIDVPVAFGDVTVRPADWVYADDDGIVVSARPLHG